MIIEYDLQGSKMLHKGIFDTAGIWVKYEAEQEPGFTEIDGWKIYSNFSFAFYHRDRVIVDEVYNVLVGCLRGSQGKDIENLGYIRKLNK